MCDFLVFYCLQDCVREICALEIESVVLVCRFGHYLALAGPCDGFTILNNWLCHVEWDLAVAKVFSQIFQTVF